MVAVLERAKNANTLGVLIRQSGNFTSYNFSAYIREAYQQNTTVYACIQEYVKPVHLAQSSLSAVILLSKTKL